MALRYFSNVAAQTALNGGVNDTTTTWTVDDGSTYPAVPFTARCENEVVLVTAKSGTNDVTWTVTRGFGDTTGASHADGLAVDHVVTAEDFRQLYVDNGTVGAPSIAPVLDTDTGLYFIQGSPNKIAFAVDGVVRAEIDSNDWEGYVPFRGTDGTSGAPTFSFSSHTTTGVYYKATDILAFAAGGTEALNVASGQILGAALGTAAAPLFVSGQEPDTGIYFTSSPGILLISTNGTERLRVDDTDLTLAVDLDVANPTDINVAATKILELRSDGLYYENANTILPSRAQVQPSEVTTFSDTNWNAVTGSAITLFDHVGTNRDIEVTCWARGHWRETGAVAYIGESRIAVSTDGGSTWGNTGIASQNYVGTGTGAEGYRGNWSIFYQGEFAAASVTGDVQARLEIKVDNTGMDGCSRMHLHGVAEGIF